MANPLAILGSIAAGLTTVGAGGASGLFEGEVGGEHLKRQYASQDLDNQLRMLHMIAQGQQLDRLNQPTYQFHGDRQIMIPPHGGQPITTELPPTRAGEARITSLTEAAEAARQRAAAAEAQANRPPRQTGLQDYLDRVQPKNAAEHLKAVRDFYESEHAGAAKERAPAHVAPGGRLVDPTTGRVIYTAPERAPKPPREIVTPRKPIWRTDELTALNTALPNLMKEALPGFQPPQSDTVTLPNGKTATSAQIIGAAEAEIKKAYLEKIGVEVTVQWVPTSSWTGGRGGQFKVVRAWEPAKKVVAPPERDERDADERQP